MESTKELKEKLNNLIQDLFEFEKQNLYKSNIHQITIDTIENLEDELSTADDLLCSFDDLVGSYVYRVGNILEICKEDTIDYSILNNLLNLFKRYE